MEIVKNEGREEWRSERMDELRDIRLYNVGGMILV